MKNPPTSAPLIMKYVPATLEDEWRLTEVLLEAIQQQFAKEHEHKAEDQNGSWMQALRTEAVSLSYRRQALVDRMKKQ